jgi:predicted small secreted protein
VNLRRAVPVVSSQFTGRKIPMMLLRAGALMLFVLLLSACNTMAGMGQDIETAGETIEREARE